MSEKYQPSPEEMKKAKEMLSPNEKSASDARDFEKLKVEIAELGNASLVHALGSAVPIHYKHDDEVKALDKAPGQRDDENKEEAIARINNIHLLLEQELFRRLEDGKR